MGRVSWYGEIPAGQIHHRLAIDGHIRSPHLMDWIRSPGLLAYQPAQAGGRDPFTEGSVEPDKYYRQELGSRRISVLPRNHYPADTDLPAGLDSNKIQPCSSLSAR